MLGSALPSLLKSYKWDLSPVSKSRVNFKAQFGNSLLNGHSHYKYTSVSCANQEKAGNLYFWEKINKRSQKGRKILLS